jgi:16S rRNA (guanine966-N2)-methyltransferase
VRIIAGEFRGRKLLPPEGTDVTRPVTDRVKQSVFDILGSEVEGRIFDLFAGTGSMGLECLSRGAVDATFFESDRSAVARLRKNIAALGVKCAYVEPGDLFQWFDAEVARPDTLGLSYRNTIDVAFLDPPYRFVRERPDPLRKLGRQLAGSILDPKRGVVVFRHDANDRLDLPGLSVVDERTYGGMTVEFLRPQAEAQ